MVDLDELGERLAFLLPGDSAHRARVTTPATNPVIALQPVTVIGEGLLRADENIPGVLRFGRPTRQWVSLHVTATGLTTGSAAVTLTGGGTTKTVTVTSTAPATAIGIAASYFPEDIVSVTWTSAANTGAVLDVWLVSAGWSA